jgi:hypothetical protein
VGEATTSVATLADLCGTEGDAKGLGNYYTDCLLFMCSRAKTHAAAPMDFVGMDRSSKGKAMGTLFVILMKDREAATFAVDKSKKDMQTITLGAATSAIRAGGAVDQTVTFGNTVQSALDSDEAQAMPIVNTVESVLHSVMSKLEMIVNIGDEIATVRDGLTYHTDADTYPRSTPTPILPGRF